MADRYYGSRKEYGMSLFGIPNIEKLKANQDVDGLIRALSYKKDLKIQKQAVEALGELKNKKAVDALIVLLSDSNVSNSIIAEILVAMGNIGDISAFESMKKFLGHGEDHVRNTAINSLGHLGEPRAIPLLLTMMGDKNRYVRSTALEALEKLSYPELDNLLDSMLSQEKDEWVRSTALHVMERVKGSSALELFLLALKDASEIIRMTAIGILHNQLDPRSFPHLYYLSKHDSDMNNKYRAEGACRSLLEKHKLDSLCEAAKDTRKEVRLFAIQELAKLKEGRSKQVFIDALADGDESVRKVAVKSLGKLKDEDTKQIFIDVLSDKDDSIREIAIKALGDIGAKDTVNLLSGSLDDNPNSISIAIKKSLKKLDPWSKKDAKKVYSSLQDSNVDELVACLSNENKYVRWAAVTALAGREETHVVDGLIRCAKDKITEVRAAAAYSLGKSSDERVFHLLLSLRSDEEIKIAASDAIGSILSRVNKFETLGSLLGQYWPHNYYMLAGFVHAFGNIQDPRVLPLLINFIQNIEPKDIFGIQKLIDILGEFEDVRIMDILITITRHLYSNFSTSDMRLAVIKALSKYENPRIMELMLEYFWKHDSNGEIRFTMIKHLERYRDSRVLFLMLHVISLSNREDISSYLVSASEDAIHNLPVDIAVNQLTEIINETRGKAEKIYTHAVIALSRIDDIRALEILTSVTPSCFDFMSVSGYHETTKSIERLLRLYKESVVDEILICLSNSQDRKKWWTEEVYRFGDDYLANEYEEIISHEKIREIAQEELERRNLLNSPTPNNF